MRFRLIIGLVSASLAVGPALAADITVPRDPCSDLRVREISDPCRSSDLEKPAPEKRTRAREPRQDKPVIRRGEENDGGDEPIEFDEGQHPLLSDKQLKSLDVDFQRGLSRYARTREGKAMIAKFGTVGEFDIRVDLVPNEEGILGTAEPAENNLAAAVGRAPFVYVVTINSLLEGVEIGNARPISYSYPTDTADLRALQIGAEILHVDFFVLGHPAGTHHDDEEFQQRWNSFVQEMGYPGFPHHD